MKKLINDIKNFKELTLGQKIILGVKLYFLVAIAGGILTVTGLTSPSTYPARSTSATSSTKPKVQTKRDAAKDAARLLGGSSRQEDQIRRLAARHTVSAQTITDKAAKSSELCQAQGHKGSIQDWAFGALTFADELTEQMALDDVFVTYVLMGCPK